MTGINHEKVTFFFNDDYLRLVRNGVFHRLFIF